MSGDNERPRRMLKKAVQQGRSEFGGGKNHERQVCGRGEEVSRPCLGPKRHILTRPPQACLDWLLPSRYGEGLNEARACRWRFFGNLSDTSPRPRPLNQIRLLLFELLHHKRDGLFRVFYGGN